MPGRCSPRGRWPGRQPQDVSDVLEFEVRSGRLTGRKVTVPGYPLTVEQTPDDRTVW